MTAAALLVLWGAVEPVSRKERPLVVLRVTSIVTVPPPTASVLTRDQGSAPSGPIWPIRMRDEGLRLKTTKFCSIHPWQN